jgi:hypothetical protein
MISLYFLFLGYEIIRSDYLLTDEAYMLWYQADHHTVFNIFHSEGRSLTGWLEQWLFGMSAEAANVKYIRLLSLAECALSMLYLSYVLRYLQKSGLSISDGLIDCTLAFFAASLSSVICIGWAVCTEIFIPMVLGLAAGMLLYRQIMKDPVLIKIPVRISWQVLVLGIVALFFYQSTYSFFLLPFYLLFLVRKDGRLTRPLYIALFFYFASFGLYYILFKLLLKVTGVVAADRTILMFDPLNRLSFFFSFPMNQAFNINAFFDSGSVLSQAVFPVLLVAWVIYVLFSRRGQTMKNVRYLAGMIVCWILGYLPLLIARENFGPYRTMIVLSIMVFLMLGEVLLSFLKGRRGKEVLVFVIVVVLLVRGGYVYKAYLADPLREEFRIVQKEVRKGYRPGIRRVIFLLAPENGFQSSFGIDHFKDEFGMPSTHKDWTPEPLIKQLVYEMTGDRAGASALEVAPYESRASVNEPSLLNDPGVLVVDMPTLLAAEGGRQGR